MLMLEMKAAEAAKVWAVLDGKRPPPICKRPPTAVIPEMAFVTDMSGEWRAGVTPQTVWYPTMQPRPNVVVMVVNAAFGALIPRVISVPSPPVYIKESFNVLSWQTAGQICYSDVDDVL